MTHQSSNTTGESRKHNGTYDETTYDNKGRVWKAFTRLTNNGTDPFQRTYTYDAANRITNLVDKYNTANAVSTDYSYDDAGQLTQESRPGYVVGYDYDANGNRWHRTKNGVVETYNCDAADKLASMSDTNGFARSFTYDLAGRMTTDSRTFNGGQVDDRVYTWNQGGRLTNHTSSLTGQNQSDSYNAAGARVSSVITPGQPATTYRRAGMGVLAPVLSEWKNGASVASYTSGISERRGATSTWSHAGIKNFDYQSKSNSTVASARRYDAFGDGQTQVSGSFWRGPWGYGGPFGYYSTDYGPQLIGIEAGFTPTEPIKQIGHRWYDPSIGRFLSRDPAESGRNWFAYCGNNPITGVDPSGNIFETILDVGGLLLDVSQMWQHPSVENGLFLTWSLAATAVPFVPGSWAGRGVKAAAHAVEAAHDASAASHAVADGGEVLYRYGRGKSKLKKLAKDAAKAEASDKFGHGVSVNSRPHPKGEHRSAKRSDVEKIFEVRNTGGPGHRTVILPKPVTPGAVKDFNDLFR